MIRFLRLDNLKNYLSYILNIVFIFYMSSMPFVGRVFCLIK
ncbi:hypothetical protein CNEO_10221 [Clostridium neonatale]|uniref:Uncharacterized protein n=1 Tax=Clostridium neonatale TaxID=137838 RepID=A0AA86MK29_9CLOT|nr:hypothetical protein CNEO_10221 [Clostridium neonatale]